MKLFKNIKEKWNIIRRYLKEAPDNISKYDEWKLLISEEEKSYYSKYNQLNIHSNPEKTILWQYLNLNETEERYWDWHSKNAKLMDLINPTIKYLQHDLEWGEYLTYDIGHVEDKDNPNSVIMTYIAIFKFTPNPLIEEDMSYEDYVKKYKKIRNTKNFLIGGILISILGIILGFIL